jgi:anti-sigma factor RsiW
MSEHLTDNTLNEYLDSALAPARREDVERHLAACRECALRLERIRGLFVRLDSLPDLPLERDLSPGVLTRIRSDPSRPAPRARAWRLGLLFAAQALLALLLLALGVPFVVRWLQLPDLAQVSADLASTWSGLTTSALEEWNALVAGLIRLLTLPAALPDLSLPAVPAAGLALALVAAGFLWLVGNGVLLRAASRVEHR